VEAEEAACAAYLALKADLAENDGVFVDLDSAYRSVGAQREIMDRFTEEYGADYAAKTVAKPGYSEHHTGLALDLYLNIDGEDVYYNEDMIRYPEIWAKIHAKLADYGFILRYPEDMEHITGYGYEPWHIRYVGSAETAHEIEASGLTFEGWLGAVNETKVEVDYGESKLYTTEELKEAAVQVKCNFAFWTGCELRSLRYAGDGSCTEENVKWANEINPDGRYTEVVEFIGDFHSPVEAYGAWEADTEYTDYQWWLGRNAESGWDLFSSGY
jgi:D-alanyl-D-alanine carboxypeptidase